MTPDPNRDPNQRRIRADNLGLRRLAELNRDLLTVEFEGAPYPDSRRIVLGCTVRFAEAYAASKEGFRVRKGDTTVVLLPDEYPAQEALFVCRESVRFHCNLSGTWFGAACMGISGGWAPSISLWRAVAFYYDLLTGKTFNPRSPMPDPISARAALVYPRLAAEGRLPFDTARFVFPDDSEGVDEHDFE